jgi:hypothetical protein
MMGSEAAETLAASSALGIVEPHRVRRASRPEPEWSQIGGPESLFFIRGDEIHGKGTTAGPRRD